MSTRNKRNGKVHPRIHKKKSREDQTGFGSNTFVAHAIAKMRRGQRSRKKNKSLEIGSNAELRQTQSLLRDLDNLILPSLEDVVQASLSSKTRQDQTRPERCKDLQTNSEDPKDNPYAAVVVSQSLNLTTSITQLCESTVIIVGLNGTGAKLATLLARRGLGKLILMDPSSVRPNEWRHSLEFTPSMEGLSKARAMCGLIAELNADTKVEAACCDVRDSTGSTLLAYCMNKKSMVVPINCMPAAATTETKKVLPLNQEPLKMYALDVYSQSDTPRQLKTRMTYVHKLPVKTVNFDDLMTSSGKDDLRNSHNVRKKDIIVACCDDDPVARIIVGEFAMEFGLTALYATPGRSTKSNALDPETLGAKIPFVPASLMVVPGVTACLQCHQSVLETRIALFPRMQQEQPNSSSATHAIMASTLCQAALRSLLSNAHNNNTTINTKWYADRDMIEAHRSEKPSRKCRSLHCRNKQGGYRSTLRKKKMRGVIKMSNMFAWTKKKATANLPEKSILDAAVRIDT
jgi:hypothetical protein